MAVVALASFGRARVANWGSRSDTAEQTWSNHEGSALRNTFKITFKTR